VFVRVCVLEGKRKKRKMEGKTDYIVERRHLCIRCYEYCCRVL
jgi:hypothetical protein